MKRLILIAAAAIGAMTASAQRIEIPLNDNWQFRFAHQVDARQTELVQLPHTWNTVDALVGKIDYKRGIGNYSKKFTLPADWRGKRVFVRFGGANSVASVFLNGEYVGDHKGGYSAFAFELTDKLRPDAPNELLVRVNNAENLDIPPLVGDFNMYGGLYRGVELIATDSVCISPLFYASPGVIITQKSLTKNKAQLDAKVVLSAPVTKNATLKWRVTDPDGKVAASGERKVDVASSEQIENVSFAIGNPHLWNSTADPALYEIEVSVIDGADVVDKVTQTFGLRDFKVDPQKGAFLNGEHINLKGVCRHQERAQLGSAIGIEHHKQDLDIIREMGANAIRFAHYQQADEVYDLPDRYGIMAWAEIPFVGPGGYADTGFVNSAAFKDNARQQLCELIYQQANHPSIVCWGLFNELKEDGDSPDEFIAELNDLAHSLDPSRPTTAASNIDGGLNYITDLIAWNRYDGWYGSTPATLAKWLDATHERHPEISIAVSEYGAGASIYHQQDSLVQPAPAGRWHPENWQTYYHIENWKILHERPFVWGSFVWNMFDFGAAHRTEGDRIGINDKGLVTHDRATRKDAFYFYKANWNPEPMVHIAGKRAIEREKADTEVMVFANVPAVELWLNGAKAGEAAPDDYRICTFAVSLRDGENVIEARTPDGKIVDACVWNLMKKI